MELSHTVRLETEDITHTSQEESHSNKTISYAVPCLIIFFVFLMFSGCAPKKVKIYDTISTTRENIIQFAMSLHGKPYKSGAKGPHAFDCSGFVHYVYKNSGITLPITTEELNKVGYEVSNTTVMPGDLVLFSIKKDLHIGIMLNRREFIHASKTRGVAIDTLDTQYWSKYLRGFRSVL